MLEEKIESEVEVKKTKINEVELYLNLAKSTHPEIIEGKTYFQISKALNRAYKINCDEFDISLLHEPTIYEMEDDLRVQFEAIGLVY